jgi:hypothetical protein
VFTKYSGMCFAKAMAAYLFENRQLIWIGVLTQVFEIEHHRPNPRTARNRRWAPEAKDTQASTTFLVAEDAHSAAPHPSVASFATLFP